MAQRFDANTYPLEPGLRLLEASAGTGKTFALAHLTLRLITEAGHSLEQLLVVTYTDAAAEELRSRIGQRLQQALAGLERIEVGAPAAMPDSVLEDWCMAAVDPPQRRLWIRRLLVALEQLDRADIATIHSFCRRNLRRLALISGAAMEPTLETDAAVLQSEVVQDLWQREMLTLPLDQLRGLRQRGVSPERLQAFLAQLDSDSTPLLDGGEAATADGSSLAECLDVSIAEAWSAFLPSGSATIKPWMRDSVPQQNSGRALASNQLRPTAPNRVRTVAHSSSSGLTVRRECHRWSRSPRSKSRCRSISTPAAGVGSPANAVRANPAW